MNTITIELCAEDRERIDRLTLAIEAMAGRAKKTEGESRQTVTAEADPDQLTVDPEQTKPQAGQEAAGAAEGERPTENTPEPQEAAEAAQEPTAEPPKPSVTKEQIQKKALELSTVQNGAKKEKMREIINAYAKKVSDLPADKWGEVWAKLIELEKEG